MTSHRHTPSYPHGLSSIYAIPAHRSNGENGLAGSGGLSYAEHELRRSRKTPQGRIDEHFEATYLDNIHIPASKHLLLSVVPQSLESPRYYTDPQLRSENQNHLLNNSYDGINHGQGLQPRSHHVTTRRPQDFVGGIDSALHQTITVGDQKLFYHPGSQIPTALPATFHAHLGPTASAAQQYYGPYWPDGTFSPYRPAPIRDSRFFEPGFRPFDPQALSVVDARTLRRPGRLCAPRSSDLAFSNFTTQPPRTTAQAYLPFFERIASSIVTHNAISNHLGGTQDYNGMISTNNGSDIHPTQTPDCGHWYTTLQPGEASDRLAFRDKSFSWAYHIYVNLLAKIQRENRLGRPSTNAYGQFKEEVKPTIYPKPPSRSGSFFKEPINSSQISRSQGPHSKQNIWSDEHNESGKRPRTAIYLPQRRALDHNTHSHDGVVRQQRLTQRIMPLEPYVDHYHVCDGDRRCLQDDKSQYSTSPEAPAALETMELLCEEADMPWTDGMLLAGCLAYGLGDYTKALKWYKKVLVQDPQHVEAFSNQAATLLALGRRDDALQNWSTAVKLRPSYFEAIEHLIGLLCTMNQAKDAVEMINYVESRLKLPNDVDTMPTNDTVSDGDSDTRSQSSSITTVASNEQGVFEYDAERRASVSSAGSNQHIPGFASSGYAIPGADTGRLLALIHAKGNMLYSLGQNAAAAAAFEDAILIATEHRHNGISGLVKHILDSCVSRVDQFPQAVVSRESSEPILLSPEKAQQTAQRMFPPAGELPGLEHVPKGPAYKAAISTTSNSLLSLAKIYQDGMGNTTTKLSRRQNGTREILALYYLSISLQRSPSTANNVGILLASVQQTTNKHMLPQCTSNQMINYAGIAPGSGVALALQYYNYGLNIDPKHAHLYTNLGSLLKDLGQLTSAIKMYEIAVQCDGNFDIALANLANAVKDQGRIAEAISYYRRAVQANPDFAEAVCGLATALNSVCNWYGRGGVYADNGLRDRIHVDEQGRIQDARRGCGWMSRVVEIVDKQLQDGGCWGTGTLTPNVIEQICHQLSFSEAHLSSDLQQRFTQRLRQSLQDWSGKRWEGARVVRLIERAIRRIGWQWYQDRYKAGKEYSTRRYARPSLPALLSTPTVPTVLPFHTFTTPLSAKQVRQISQRNALRISVAALRSPWLPPTVYPPPRPPSPYLKVGYVSSDFNNHPLAHLMQSIFGLHDGSRVQAFCYATTASDGSTHRQQIEQEAPVFHDTSTWSIERLTNQIVKDGIHILVNLNGYTRGAKNEVFAARPAPIHMSFMGFAGTLGAEWCDYVFADSISVLPTTLSPWRRNVDIEDRLHPDAQMEDQEDWVYSENIIFAKSTFFCVDHKQSAPDAETGPPASYDRSSRDAAWKTEQDRRWRLRKELFPTLSDTAIVLGNFNQLYKIDPATFRMYLRIVAAVPNCILWLLRFPDVGEQNLKTFAREWAGAEVANRIVFTDVAPKGAHITRASVVDLFLDTPECNAHTTAADVIWSGTPILTWARWDYKMCSRMASSIVASALPVGSQGDEMRRELLVDSDEKYERHAISLAMDMRYPGGGLAAGRGRGRLMELRRILWEGRWTSRLFDTKRWVRDLEDAYWEAWRKWETGEGGDIRL